MLHSEKLGPLNDRQREVLRDMQASGKRLQQFIQDFLTYSALETGGLRMQFEPGNINECLSEVSPPVVESLSAKGTGALFSGQRQAAGFSLRYSQTGARDLEPAGEFLQVHAHRAERCGCTPSRICGNAAPRLSLRPPSAAVRT